MRLGFHGATGTVTGSKYLVCTEKASVLVDCGLFQGYKELRLRHWSPLPFEGRALDAVVLTHAHLDHSGYLPLLIRVERPLDFDSDGQLAASVISKKVAAGSTHLIVDMPVGTTAKVRTPEAARVLSERLVAVAQALGLDARVIETDGSQPVGRGIGPALEARDVLAVLQNDAADLRGRALMLAGALLELGGGAAAGAGAALAAATLDGGAAWRKFQAICEAQGGLRTPPTATLRRDFTAERDGRVAAIDNRRLARAAKLAGAPAAPAAGALMQVRLGETVERGQPLFTLHAQSPGELNYAAAFLGAAPLPVSIGDGT